MYNSKEKTMREEARAAIIEALKDDYTMKHYDYDTSKNQTIMGCFISYHKWTNSISLAIHYEHFMLVGYIFETKGGTGWEVQEKERPSKGDVEIPFEVAKMLSFLVDPENPLTGEEEEKIKKDSDWCFVTYPTPLHGSWDWISDLMPYEAYLNARESGCYQHSDYFVATFNSYEEAKKAYKEITASTALYEEA